jgi:hypothetical protein
MPQFHVRHSFEIPDRKLFVMAGSIVEGEIRTGMFVRVPLNSDTGIRLFIDSIEFARRHDGEDICLCISSGPNFTEVLRGFDFRDQTFEVAEIHNEVV